MPVAAWSASEQLFISLVAHLQQSLDALRTAALSNCGARTRLPADVVLLCPNMANDACMSSGLLQLSDSLYARARMAMLNSPVVCSTSCMAFSSAFSDNDVIRTIRLSHEDALSDMSLDTLLIVLVEMAETCSAF